jgi:hypothetical protein
MKKIAALKLVTRIRHTYQSMSRSFPLTGLSSFFPSNGGTYWNSLGEVSLELIRSVLGAGSKRKTWAFRLADLSASVLGAKTKLSKSLKASTILLGSPR